ncbi:MAG TPA: hypothetical protein VLT45_00420 [Kofleriaceae bacterium]|nr:hypothetical protein [Kofleriaceae bacterium]
MGRLALAVGPLRSVHTHNAGEPDGYSGLSRRGSYERLVTVDWGIADLFPDEFLRRAASGEHLFLDLARREPRGALRSIAIVSAGPAQLGAPRLAHLATLIVLARRAAVAGAGFSWGVLEDEERRLIDGLNENGIRRLLGARTVSAAPAGAFQAWANEMGGGAETDFWFVGADEDAVHAADVRASRIIVRDVLEPSTRALELEIGRRGPATRLRLELPTPEQCARLLRDPFARGGSESRVAAAKGQAREIRFAPGGRRLVVRLDGGVFESWAIPSSTRDKVGQPRRWTPPAGHVVLSVGTGKRSVLAVTANPKHPTVIELSHTHNPRLPIKFLPEAFANHIAADLADGELPRIGTCAIVRASDSPRQDLIIEILGRLFAVSGFALWPKPGTVLTALPLTGGVTEVPRRVVAAAFLKRSVVWAQQHDGVEVRVTETTASGNKQVARTTSARESPEVHFGFSMPPSEFWAVAAIERDANWGIAAPTLDTSTFFDVAVPVVGVCIREGRAALLTRPHPYRLAWVTLDTNNTPLRELLPPARQPIVSVAVCPSQPNIAWLTESGEIVVYSVREKAVLFRRMPGGAP